MSNKAQITPLVVIILLFVIVSSIAFVYFLSTQMKLTVKEQKMLSAYNIAHAGLEQTINKVNSIFRGWEKILEGSIPDGYNGERIFEYMYKGKKIGYYRVKISSAPGDIVIIHTIATDPFQREAIKLKAIYKAAGYESPIVTLGKARTRIRGEAEVHWGPIVATETNLELGEDVPWFPRKYAGRGFRVIPRDPNAAGEPPDYGFSSGYTGPPNNPKYAEWTSNAIVNPEPINLTEYMEKAKEYRPPFRIIQPRADRYRYEGYLPGIKRPVVEIENLIPFVGVDGSTRAYFYRPVGVDISDTDFEFHDGFRDYCSTATYYIEGHAEFRDDDIFIGPLDGRTENNEVALIVLGRFKTNGKGGIRPYTIRVPENAEDEYKNGTVVNPSGGDTAAANEYPADKGLNAAQTFTIDVNTVIGGRAYDLIYFNGFLYAGMNVEIRGDEIFAGVIHSVGAVTRAAGSTVGSRAIIFYSEVVERNIRYTQRVFKLREITTRSASSFSEPL